MAVLIKIVIDFQSILGHQTFTFQEFFVIKWQPKHFITGPVCLMKSCEKQERNIPQPGIPERNAFEIIKRWKCNEMKRQQSFFSFVSAHETAKKGEILVSLLTASEELI